MTSSATKQKLRSDEKTIPSTRRANELLFLSPIFLFSALSAIWLSLDHSYPMWDAASHIKDSMKYEQLFRHPHFWKPEWIKEFLTVNPAYPLTIHAFNGFLKAIFGLGRFTEGLSLVLFSLVMNASVFGMGKLLFRSALVGCLAVIFINCYPLVSILSHMPMLDFPQLSLHCLAMYALVWWLKKPTWTAASLAGLALGLASTSKQTAALFLIGPCLYLLVRCALEKDKRKVLQLSWSGIITAASLGLWIFPNLGGLKSYLDYNGSICTADRSFGEIFSTNITSYLSNLPAMTGPILLAAAFLSIGILAVRKSTFLAGLILPAIASVTGVLAMSMQSCNNPELRYIIPVALLAALATAAGLYNILGFDSPFKHQRPSTVALSISIGLPCAAVFLFLLSTFSPYPLPTHQRVVSTVATLAGHPVSIIKMEPSMCPTAVDDAWRQHWIVNTIAKANNNSPTLANIFPSTPDLSVHTLNLVAAYDGAKVEMSTFRQYTIKGDRVRFEQDAIDTYPWYVVKTGFQGYSFYDQESKQNYERIQEYVLESGKYSKYADCSLPDGSILSLFRRKDFKVSTTF